MQEHFEKSGSDAEHGFFARLRMRPRHERRILFFASFFSVGAILFVLWAGEMQRQFGVAFGGSSGGVPVLQTNEGGSGVSGDSSSGVAGVPGPLATLRENFSFLRSEITNLVGGLQNTSGVPKSDGAPEINAGEDLSAGGSLVPVEETSGSSVFVQKEPTPPAVLEKGMASPTPIQKPIAVSSGKEIFASAATPPAPPPLFKEASATDDVARPRPVAARVALMREETGMQWVVALIRTNGFLWEEGARDGWYSVAAVLSPFLPAKQNTGEKQAGAKFSFPSIFSFPQISFEHVGEVFRTNGALVAAGFRDFIYYVTH